MHENRCDDRGGAITLIDEIRELNPSAEVGFLAEFPATELERYLQRLLLAVESPKSMPWIRRNDVWPVAMRDCA